MMKTALTLLEGIVSLQAMFNNAGKEVIQCLVVCVRSRWMWVLWKREQ